MTTLQMSSQLELHRLNTGRQVKVATAVRLLRQMLFKYQVILLNQISSSKYSNISFSQGHVGCALILGGIDSTGPHVVCIHPHGSSDSLPYVTMGSGSLAAMSFLEAHWKPNLNLEEAKELMSNAICGGVYKDLVRLFHNF